jgi:hypothetical protein
MERQEKDETKCFPGINVTARKLLAEGMKKRRTPESPE